MRVNLPVTAREYVPPPELQSLVSVTDTKGRITYCNEAFVTVSGYTASELLGQAHNIVRHPDMPEEAFRDLWETIQKGLPWTGLVKNRRKDGDHYWVVANATPTKDGNEITGYLSVRTTPERADIEAAEHLYAQLREQAKTGQRKLGLRQGRVIHFSPWAKFWQMLGRLLGLRLIWFQLAVAAAAVFSALWLPFWATVLITAATLTVTAYLTLKQVLWPLRQLLDDSRRLGAVDLAHAITLNTNGLTGDLQKALRQLQVNIRAVILNTQTDVDRLKPFIAAIAQGNQDLSARTESQAGSLERTAASIEQIHGTVSQSAESAQRGADIAASTSTVASRSNDAVHAVAQTMGSISESSKRIGEIIQVVEGVAFQTNILALNAAVEAARAGESGRGFAVVATEVRSLAHRTSEAAKEIKKLIQESADRVSRGEVEVVDATKSVASALASVGEVSQVLADISRSAVEQEAGISQINDAVSQLDQITQQNTAMVEELAAAAQSLRSQVDTVSIATRIFRLKPGEKTVSQLDAVALRKLNRTV
ncbi:Chemotaxis protein [Rubrivivax sp. A210]|uniref:methyl-accepting chemotaxis protein n=1 Tax=Rubrivivax sp. A210 TaxID=2772301 RepID=UPI0019195EB1|nr:methyl-accepting chemotaxis protein [Rubrivivax sp. A210]CAD5369667.1 Chemotaxis protein [Rubrivivax sp. A210]